MRVRIGIVLLALTVAVVALAVLGRPSHAPTRPPGAEPAAARPRQPCQTSDCEPGEIAEKVSPFATDRPRITKTKHWKIAPGINFKRWVRTDRRGPQRIFLTTVNTATPG